MLLVSLEALSVRRQELPPTNASCTARILVAHGSIRYNVDKVIVGVIAPVIADRGGHMATRKAKAEWKGSLREGKGTMRLGSGAYEGAYSFQSRFEEGTGTNPEELIGAAHAGCFSMALSAGLGKVGFEPKRITTEATVQLEKVGEGFQITKIHLDTEAEIPKIEKSVFEKHAQEAKSNCPVSKALAGPEITLTAKLVS